MTDQFTIGLVHFLSRSLAAINRAFSRELSEGNTLFVSVSSSFEPPNYIILPERSYLLVVLALCVYTV